MIKDDELLEKYNEIWEEVKNSMEKEFDSEPVYNEKYLKAKIKSYNGKIYKNFYKRRFSLYLFISNFDRSVLTTGNNDYPQVLLEECKHVVKEKKMPENITDDMEISSDDSDREASDEENCIEENSDYFLYFLFLYLKYLE